MTSVNSESATTIIPEIINECSLVAKNRDEGICLSDKSLNVAAELIEADPKNLSPDEIIEKVKEKLNCTSQRCILASKEFRSRSGGQLADKELKENFKVEGPTDVSLLSNYNIDLTLQQWAKTKFNNPTDKFFAYNFNMRDFVKQGDTLHTIPVDKLVERGYKTFACVVNTDYYNGRGKHWMALFGDMRGDPWTVEFFNSSGNEPSVEFSDWLIKSQLLLEKFHKTIIIKCTGVEHQKSRTECGVYSLYYIWARLHGTPAEYFLTHEINDVLCFEMRQHLFHDPRRSHIPMQKYSYPAWSLTTRVEWEPEVKPSDIPKITGQREMAVGGADDTTDHTDHTDHIDHTDLFEDWIENGFDLSADRPPAQANCAPPAIALLPLRAQLLACCLAITSVPFIRHIYAFNIQPAVIDDLKTIFSDRVFSSGEIIPSADYMFLVDNTDGGISDLAALSPFVMAMIHRASDRSLADATMYFVPWSGHTLCLSVLEGRKEGLSYKMIEADPAFSENYYRWVGVLPIKSTKSYDLQKGYDGCMDCAAEQKIIKNLNATNAAILSESLYVWPHGLAGDLDNDGRFQLLTKLFAKK